MVCWLGRALPCGPSGSALSTPSSSCCICTHRAKGVSLRKRPGLLRTGQTPWFQKCGLQAGM